MWINRPMPINGDRYNILNVFLLKHGIKLILNNNDSPLCSIP